MEPLRNLGDSCHLTMFYHLIFMGRHRSLNVHQVGICWEKKWDVGTPNYNLHDSTFSYYHQLHISMTYCSLVPDSKVHGANMGPTWGRQDPGGPHVGHMNLAIWGTKPSLYNLRHLQTVITNYWIHTCICLGPILLTWISFNPKMDK